MADTFWAEARGRRDERDGRGLIWFIWLVSFVG